MFKNYKKSYLVINVILGLLLFFLMLNLFVFKITSYKLLTLILLIPTIFIILRYGYEKKSRRFKYETVFYVFAYCALFLLVTYTIGLKVGFNKNVYKLNYQNLIHNIIPYLILIITSEILRYEISRKGDGSTLAYALVTAILICVDLSLFLTTYELSIGDEQIKYICVIAIPSIFKNIILLYLTKNGGIYPSLLYRIILDLKLVILPIFPAFGPYGDSLVYTIFPVLMGLLILLHLKQFQNKDNEVQLKKTSLYKYIIVLILFGIVLVLNLLVSGTFKYNMIAIGSGSMTPTINKGDAIIYEKYNGTKLPEVGDILVFHKNDKTVVHRIIEIIDIDDKERVYYTKGDNNDTPDGYPIVSSDIVGVVKKRVRYIGIPSVAISEAFK